MPIVLPAMWGARSNLLAAFLLCNGPFCAVLSWQRFRLSSQGGLKHLSFGIRASGMPWRLPGVCSWEFPALGTLVWFLLWWTVIGNNRLRWQCVWLGRQDDFNDLTRQMYANQTFKRFVAYLRVFCFQICFVSCSCVLGFTPYGHVVML